MSINLITFKGLDLLLLIKKGDSHLIEMKRLATRRRFRDEIDFQSRYAESRIGVIWHAFSPFGLFRMRRLDRLIVAWPKVHKQWSCSMLYRPIFQVADTSASICIMDANPYDDLVLKAAGSSPPLLTCPTRKVAFPSAVSLNHSSVQH